MTQRAYHAEHLWQPDGWRADARIDTEGVSVRAIGDGDGDGACERLGRYVLPGLPNIHSHAFQRAMAGLAERQTHPEDSFWTWREVMYGFASRLDPDALRDIAAQLYAEMLASGYTQVCEFHYLHHAPDGRPYADPAAMSLALVEAAHETGIGLTLLPVLYMAGGFDGRPLAPRQRRFAHGVDDYLALLERLRAAAHPQLRVGIAFHSLRAVPPEAMRAVLEALPASQAAMPIHLHIAEQTAEVDECLAARGARPVEWLLDAMPVDARWTLVHATHLSDDEVTRTAASGAVVALCPTTEANLGDGVFPLRAYLDAGGAWGIGSDSHISVSPVEELRWLEYGQRLLARRRNIAVSAERPSTGESLFAAALAGGRQAAGPGVEARADFLVLDDEAPELAARDTGTLIDSWLFSGNRPLLREVVAGGRRVVERGVHVDAGRIAARYRRALQRLG